MSSKERTPSQVIKALGFHNVEDFQRGWFLGDALAVDGKLGPKTKHAALESWERHEDGKADLSPHFSAGEFTCPCCRRTRVYRGLLRSLEILREINDHPLRIVSGYRCPDHNHAVGGASSSQHQYGGAADIDPTFSLERVKSLGTFAGIGVKRTGKVIHVDRRDITGHNNGGSQRQPVVWFY